MRVLFNRVFFVFLIFWILCLCWIWTNAIGLSEAKCSKHQLQETRFFKLNLLFTMCNCNTHAPWLAFFLAVSGWFGLYDCPMLFCVIPRSRLCHLRQLPSKLLQDSHPRCKFKAMQIFWAWPSKVLFVNKSVVPSSLWVSVTSFSQSLVGAGKI